MMLSEETRDGVLILRCHEPRIDASHAPAFREEVIRRIEGGPGLVVLDLSEVTFVDSSGLGAIVSCLKRLGPRGNMAIAGARGAVMRLFTLTRMDKIFSLHDTAEAAVARLNG
ncbi:MAG TPA: STAS domain-containing protein [Salinarimonas sp.]|jgi:anti-sigma B factor antagonist|nr:STAS domain-containing protein [Salinarimonas sp.]